MDRTSQYKLAGIEERSRSCCCELSCACHIRSNRWTKVIFCSLLLFVHIGFLYNFGLFFDELQQTFQSNAALTGWVGSISYCFFTFGTLLTTWTLRHLSYRKVGVIGVILGSVSLTVCSFSPTIVYVIIAYGVFFGMSSNMSLLVAYEIAVLLFRDKWRASALTLIGLGATVGNLSMSNLIEYILELVGWRSTFRIFAALLFIVGIGCSTFLSTPKISNQPQGKGVDEKAKKNSNEHLLCFPEVWLFSLSTLSCCVAMVFQYVNMASFFESVGLADQKSATGITLLALGDASAKVLIIFIAPCISSPLIYCLPVSILASSIFSVALTWTKSPYAIFVISFCYGLPRGVYNALQLPTGLEVFGTSRSKTTENVLYIWNGLGNLAGPFIHGSLYDITGSYYPALYFCAALYLVSSVTMLMTPLWQKYFAPDRYMVDYQKGAVSDHRNHAIQYVYLEQRISVV